MSSREVRRIVWAPPADLSGKLPRWYQDWIDKEWPQDPDLKDKRRTILGEPPSFIWTMTEHEKSRYPKTPEEYQQVNVQWHRSEIGQHLFQPDPARVWGDKSYPDPRGGFMQEFLVAINHAEFITIDLCRADPKRPVYLTRIDPYVVGWCAPATRDRLLNYKEWIGGAEVRECTEFDPGEFGFRWPSSKGSRAKELPRKLRDSWSAKLKRLNPGKGLLQLKLSNPTRACYITIWGPEDGSTLDFWTHVCQALGCDVEIGRRVEAFLEAELEERERAVAVFEGGKSSSSTFGDGKRG